MSLQEAVLEIANEMEKVECESAKMGDSKLIEYAKQLRRAVKAAEPPPLDIPVGLSVYGKDPKVVAERRAARQKLLEEEQTSSRVVPFVGGPDDGDSIVLDSTIQTGWTKKVGGSAGYYVLKEDGKLYFQE